MKGIDAKWTIIIVWSSICFKVLLKKTISTNFEEQNNNGRRRKQLRIENLVVL